MRTFTLEHRRKLSEAHKGKKLSAEHIEKIKKTHKERGVGMWMTGRTGENANLWKGEDVGYYPLHSWIRRIYGGASKCELADETCKGRFEWSNISGDYHRDIADFQQLCKSHHKRYDNNKKERIALS